MRTLQLAAQRLRRARRNTTGNDRVTSTPAALGGPDVLFSGAARQTQREMMRREFFRGCSQCGATHERWVTCTRYMAGSITAVPSVVVRPLASRMRGFLAGGASNLDFQEMSNDGFDRVAGQDGVRSLTRGAGWWCCCPAGRLLETSEQESWARVSSGTYVDGRFA